MTQAKYIGREPEVNLQPGGEELLQFLPLRFSGGYTVYFAGISILESGFWILDSEFGRSLYGEPDISADLKMDYTDLRALPFK